MKKVQKKFLCARKTIDSTKIVHYNTNKEYTNIVHDKRR